ncbi:MAG: ketopantoate reductase family protein [Sulfolobales archaeon]
MVSVNISIVGAGSVGVFLTYILNKRGLMPKLVFKKNIEEKIFLRTSSGEDYLLRYKPALYKDYSDWLSSDVIIIATKAYDAEEIIRDIADRAESIRTLLLVQNGLKVLEKAIERFGGEKVVQILLNHGIARIDKNFFLWSGGGKSYIGTLLNVSNPYIEKLSDLLGEIDLEIVRDIQPYRWLKLSVNAVINPITAIIEERNRVVIENMYVRDYLAKKICEEVREVAGLYNISLPKDPYEEVIRVARETGNNYSSMYMDIRYCRRTEIDYINGAVVEYGLRRGFKALYNETLYYLVKAKEARCIG